MSESEITETAEATASRQPHRELDGESLKSLAHPLRLQLLDVLSTYGPHTASGLAERLGESSGATSYHLRQLEKHGFVREVEGRGSARERWWERMPGAIDLTPRSVSDTPSARAAARLVMRNWEQNRAQLLTDFSEQPWDALPAEWMDASELSTVNLRLTSEQLAGVTTALHAFMNEHIESLRGRNDPGSRPVQIHFNAFPIVDGDITPGEVGEQ
jgi:DNA-binding MarR family transcriptional regulator